MPLNCSLESNWFYVMWILPQNLKIVQQTVVTGETLKAFYRDQNQDAHYHFYLTL